MFKAMTLQAKPAKHFPEIFRWLLPGKDVLVQLEGLFHHTFWADCTGLSG